VALDKGEDSQGASLLATCFDVNTLVAVMNSKTFGANQMRVRRDQASKRQQRRSEPEQQRSWVRNEWEMMKKKETDLRRRKHYVQNCVMNEVQVTLSRMRDMTRGTCNVTGWPFMQGTRIPALSHVTCAVAVHRGSQGCQPHDSCMTFCHIICACHGTRVLHMNCDRTV
jgi:hypothetical protein